VTMLSSTKRDDEDTATTSKCFAATRSNLCCPFPFEGTGG
jgi:hypothetical protein